MPQRADKDQARERFEAKKRQLYDRLMGRIIDTGARSEDMSRACMAAARYVAEAVAADRDVRVNGIDISAGQYWEVVSRVNGARLEDTLRAIAARDCLAMISNRRGYLLASVYNCALWESFGEIEPNARELARLAGGWQLKGGVGA